MNVDFFDRALQKMMPPKINVEEKLDWLSN